MCRFLYIIMGWRKWQITKKMYSILFNKITDIIEQLQEVQNLTEDLYIDSAETQLIEIKKESGENDPE